MKNVSRWFTLVSAVAVSIVAAGCGSKSMSGPSEVVSGARTEEQVVLASTKAAVLANTASEVELVGFVKSVSAPNLTVGGRTVVTSHATEIKRNNAKVPFGSIKVGDHLKVQGLVRSDGKVQAREIKVAYKGTTPNTIPGDSPGHHNGTDDGPNHDAGDDNGGGNDDGPNHDAGDDNGNDGGNHNAGDDNGNHGSGHN